MTDLHEARTPEQESEQGELNRAIRSVISTTAGKRLLFWMLSECKIYSDAFSGDDAATNYTLGLQSAGKRLIAKLDEIDARFYPQLLLAIADMRETDRAIARAKADNTGEDDEDAP